MLKIAAILLLSTAGQAISGDGIRIIDGDTLSLSGTTFRLHGIDAPEYGQKCATPSGVNGGVKTSQVAAQKSATVDMACLSAV